MVRLILVRREDGAMQKRTFSTFTDASNFARQHAQEIGATVKIEREDNHWAVFSAQGGASNAKGDDGYRSHTYSRQQDTPESSWWELEQKAREAVIREREKRRHYLDERENYYRSLPEEELDKHWNQREEMDLEPDETALLREIVRAVKGIKPAYGNNTRVCRQCGMVGENCTCGRSWF